MLQPVNFDLQQYTQKTNSIAETVNTLILHCLLMVHKMDASLALVSVYSVDISSRLYKLVHSIFSVISFVFQLALFQALQRHTA